MPEIHRPGYTAFQAAPFAGVIAILCLASAGCSPTSAIVFMHLMRAPTGFHIARQMTERYIPQVEK